MSRRIEWTTATTADVEVYHAGDDLGYFDAVDAPLGLFIGSGSGDGLLIEGSQEQLLALLRKLTTLIEKES